MYELKLEQFSGPIEKLYEMIEAKKMEITEVNLAEITADFLKYCESLSERDTRIIADFIVVASRLILIKSKALLPNLELTPEEEHEIKDLEARLTLYKQLKPAMRHIELLMKNPHSAYSRALFANLPPIFYPAQGISPEAMHATVKTLYESFERVMEIKTVKSSLISLEEKIKEVMERMSAAGSAKNLGDLLKEKSKTEIIVVFLAILHLLHRQILNAEQKQGFSDIMITKS